VHPVALLSFFIPSVLCSFVLFHCDGINKVYDDDEVLCAVAWLSIYSTQACVDDCRNFAKTLH